jgi:glycosyltransferase involved in cell wall biosynthesis
MFALLRVEDLSMTIRVAALTTGFLAARCFSINAHLAHFADYIASRHERTEITIFDRPVPGVPAADARWASHMYGARGSAAVTSVDPATALSKGFMECLAGYDVIYVNIYHWGQAIGRLHAAYKAVRVIYYIHSLMAHELMSGHEWDSFHYDLANQESIIEAAEGLVFPSRMEKQNTQRLYGALEAKQQTVAYPLLPIRAESVIPPNPAREINDGGRFVFIGRFVSRKGIENMLLAFFAYYVIHGGELLLLTDIPSINYVPDFFAHGHAREKARFLVERGAVSLVPWENERSKYLQLLYSILKDAICIAPSLYDPFNIVVTEALFTAPAVIVSRLCGVTELLEGHARNGRVRMVNPYSVKDLELAMSQMAGTMFENSGDRTDISFGGVTDETEYEALFNALRS